MFPNKYDTLSVGCVFVWFELIWVYNYLQYNFIRRMLLLRYFPSK